MNRYAYPGVGGGKLFRPLSPHCHIEYRLSILTARSICSSSAESAVTIIHALTNILQGSRPIVALGRILYRRNITSASAISAQISRSGCSPGVSIAILMITCTVHFMVVAHLVIDPLAEISSRQSFPKPIKCAFLLFPLISRVAIFKSPVMP